jgi:hypothetical protein
METFGIVGMTFGIFGLIAFGRLEKLIKILKEKEILDKDFK